MTQKSLIDTLKNRLNSFSDVVALQDDVRLYTYNTLVRVAIKLTAFLKQYGADSHYPVAIELPRCAELVVLVVACLFAKIPFLLINRTWPTLKKEKLIALTNPFIKISLDKGDFAFSDTDLFFFISKNIKFEHKENIIPLLGQEDFIAYFACSSGSSGEIKCALIGAQGLFLLMRNQGNYFGLVPGNKVLQVASPAFDAIISEIFVTLWSGAQLRVVSVEDNLVVPTLSMLLAVEPVDLIILTPSVARKLKPELLFNVKTLVLAGEMIDPAWIEGFIGKIRLINAFGLCEATVCSHMYEINDSAMATCIGIPLSPIETRVVDECGKTVPKGDCGELWLYGDLVGYGYLEKNQQEDTFFYDSQRQMRGFKTNDIVKVDAHNRFFYLGRRDQHIKLRGQKVNLNEVKLTALLCKGVENAHVFLLENKNKLVLVYQGESNELEMRKQLASYLPKVAIPELIINCHLPLNDNGKLDLLGLKKIIAEHRRVEFHTLVKQNTGRKIWETILEHNDFSANDNFFDIGGDSLKIVELMSGFYEISGKTLDLSVFLNEPTLGHFNRLLTAETKILDPFKLLHQQCDKIRQWHTRKPYVKNKAVKTVLMTGASGRVGAAILYHFLIHTDLKLICLGRGSVQRIFKQMFLRCPRLKVDDRLCWIICDLSDSTALKHQLNTHLIHEKIDAVIHCAAQVNHLYDLSSLYKPNVTATYHLLEWVHSKAVHKFIYISSTAAISPLLNKGGGYTGYDLSKGASEELLNCAALKGLNTCILKLPLVYDLKYDSLQILKKDHFICRLLQCIEMQLMPDLSDRLAILAAEDCAKVVSALTLTTQPLPNELILADEGISWQECLKALCHCQLLKTPYAHWREQLLQITSEEMPLTAFLPLYQANAPFHHIMFPTSFSSKENETKLESFLNSLGMCTLSSKEVLSRLSALLLPLNG
ncbi:MAG: AMP-binding protein [Rickettsiella sp.]|nr:AMP-binding protein [Rickettsiella sp.]